MCSGRMRHEGREAEILGRRHDLYQLARRANPGRWTSATRNWKPISLIVLNPEKLVTESGIRRQLS
jgi:putative transposase